MTKQVSIRSERAHALAVKLAHRHGKSITALIEEALAEKDARDESAIEERRARWRKAIAPVQSHVRDHGVSFAAEDLYGEDGLPA